METKFELETVEIDGTTVNRASLHNVSIFKELQLGIGDEVTVYKANEIIPQIRDNLVYLFRFWSKIQNI